MVLTGCFWEFLHFFFGETEGGAVVYVQGGFSLDVEDDLCGL